jgi:hypothetical protein
MPETEFRFPAYQGFVPDSSWLEPAYPIKQAVQTAIRNQCQLNEAIIRSLLERWVSGLEPSVAYDRRGNIIGLCDANAPLGSKPFILRPLSPSVSVLPSKDRK